ncbi:MAG: hypothetical protein ABIX01_11935 [Chitinophagaceae bacterium]
MAEKIVYYLGAGASSRALPVSRSSPDYCYDPPAGQAGLANALMDLDLSKEMENPANNHLTERIDALKIKFVKLAKKAGEFGDVDTYAKYLNLLSPNGDEFTSLKQTLSEYFTIKQKVQGVRDPRYLPWLVGIMNTQIFPNNVKVLSWNYDYQIQLAANHFRDGVGEDVTFSGAGFLHSPSLFTAFPNLDPTFNNHDNLSLIQLNGIAGFGKDIHGAKESMFQSKYGITIADALDFFSRDLSSELHFAWEDTPYHKNLMKHVMQMIADATILVVIGYSFPFYNRDVDKQIIEKLSHSINKIYYQDPFLDGQQLFSQFGLDRRLPIEHIRNTSSFHIPFEY